MHYYTPTSRLLLQVRQARVFPDRVFNLFFKYFYSIHTQSKIDCKRSKIVLLLNAFNPAELSKTRYKLPSTHNVIML